ncbi:spore germination protein [Bacillus marinisedimentorum]|uniref:spore germination protein n=1 Tax=Bacillus marinisedimentorum TaxID=1821260 RepID=UPI001470CC85|nr:spore germination protein [Bacillus marinisedimentorum]
MVKSLSRPNSTEMKPLTEQLRISGNLIENEKYLRAVFSNSYDVIYRKIHIGKGDSACKALFIAISGMFDQDQVQKNILDPLMEVEDCSSEILHGMETEIISAHNCGETRGFEDAVKSILKGEPALFINGLEKAYLLRSATWEMRGIQEPVTETVVRGPREGFVETLQVNTSMLRRKIRNSRLKIEHLEIGEVTETPVAVAYIDGIANKELIKEVKKRLTGIKTDAILESGYIEEFIEDAPLSVFPTVSNTERPDITAAKLLEGRVAILTEGTPVVLVVPYLMFESFQNAEDYYSRPYLSSLVRALRLTGFFFSSLAPGIYLAFQNFHIEVFPTDLLISFAAAREGVPFPLFAEILFMLLGFEFLREASVRMPRPVGQAISIVGALILGESAVNAGFVGSPTIIVIAVSAISGLVVPSLNDITSIMRLVYLVAAALFGMYGIMLVLMFWLIHVNSLTSFGVPYLGSWYPLSLSSWKDFIFRAPHWMQNRRPEPLNPSDIVRQPPGQKTQVKKGDKE